MVNLLKKIYTYCDENGVSPVLEFLKYSDDKIKKKFRYQINMLVSENKILCEPHVTEKALEYSIKLYEKLETDSLLPFQYLKEVMMGCVGL